MDDKTLKFWILQALATLYKNDSYLFQNHLSERCKVFRIGLYLDQIVLETLKGTDSTMFVDAEYTRNGDAVKCYERYCMSIKCNSGSISPSEEYMTGMKRAEPDLILHGRETTAEDPKNYLYLEFKNSNNSDNEGIDTDIKKLQCFTTENGPYGYQLGAHICLDPNYAIIVWFKNGKIENKPLLYPVKEGFSQFPNNNNTRIKFLAAYSNGRDILSLNPH